MITAQEIDFIKSRMKELGYNQRSLALAVGLKEDGVRNILDGKSKNPSIGTYNAIMSKLKEGTTQPKAVSQSVIDYAYNLFTDIIRRRESLTIKQESRFFALLQNTIAAEIDAYGKAMLSLKAAESLLDNAVLQDNTLKTNDTHQGA